jgi:hypothetical protein
LFGIIAEQLPLFGGHLHPPGEHRRSTAAPANVDRVTTHPVPAEAPVSWLPVDPRALANLQRVLLVALLAPAHLVTVLATVPALVVLPFLPDGSRRTAALLRSHAALAATLLRGSRPGK